MKFQVRPEVEQDINQIIRWYEQQQAGLGLQFYSELYDLLESIRSNPRRCPWIDESHRRCTLKRFKYGVVYRMTETEPVILSVMHLARDPDTWRSRDDT